MRIGVTFALLIALCVLLTFHGSTAPASAGPSSVVNGSDTVIEIKLRPNGDANLSVVTILPVEDTNDTVGFNKAAEEFEEGSMKGNAFDTFRSAATAANNTSNRSMSIDNESVNRVAVREGDKGKFILNFTWRNFANQSITPNGTYLTVNDAFKTPTGTWLPQLMDDQVLVIRGPDGYYVSRASAGHAKGAFIFHGRQSFDSNINITYTNGQPAPPKTTTPGPEPPAGFPRIIVGVAALITLVALGSIGIFAFSRRDGLLRRVKADGGVGTDDLERGSLSATDAQSDPDATTELDTSASVSTDTATDADTATATDADSASGASSPFDGIDVDLLSDEERVERLLEANGGRMRQANIVQETDWSNAKVSQLLSSMDEAERIEKLRIGRENLISLSDHDEDDHDEDDHNEDDHDEDDYNRS